MSRTFFVYLYLGLRRDPGRIFVDSKSALNPPMAYATDRSKAVVLV